MVRRAALRLAALGIVLAAALVASPLRARDVVTIVADDGAVSQLVSQALLDELRRAGVAPVRVLAPGQWIAADAAGIPVAVGIAAAQRLIEAPPGRTWIALMISRASYEDLLARAGSRSRDLAALLLDQPFARQFDLVRLALPNLTHLGVVLGPGLPGAAGELARAAEERGLQVSVERIAASSEIVPALDRLAEQRVRGILALPDPLVHNRNTVQPFLLATYRAGLPVIAYSEAYQQAGATLVLYSTPPQIARQAAEMILAALQGHSLPAVAVPKYFTVGTNGRVARSLGLELPAAAELQERLRQAGD